MTRTYKNKTIKKHKTKQNRTFKKKDYEKGDGMLTKVWGPALWHALHTMSFNYPVQPTDDDKKHYRDFILQMQYVLPCKYCRMNLKTNFEQLPLQMENMKNRDSFSRYVYDLHELVNKMLRKHSHLTYYDVRERYEHFRSRCVLDKPVLFSSLVSKEAKESQKEKGCTEPMYGKKAKCIIKIVPQDNRSSAFHVDKKCIKSTFRKSGAKPE